MNDYRLTFPVTALANGLEGYAVLREELAPDNAQNALGDPRDASGNIVVPDPNAPIGTPSTVVWHGRPGSAATSYTDLNGVVVQVPAKGDPALYYVHVRSEQSVAFSPDRHGMKDADAVASAAVLGIWLGDEVPV
jgi:hypothetical protein